MVSVYNQGLSADNHDPTISSVSLISLYIYDIILRLPKEVRLLWRPFTKKEFRRNLQTETSRVLFFFSQYSLIIFCILMLNCKCRRTNKNRLNPLKIIADLFPGDSRDANTKRVSVHLICLNLSHRLR